MRFSKSIVLTATADYSELNKPTLTSLSTLMIDILARYGCTSSLYGKFALNGCIEDLAHFDAVFDNAARYDTISLYASGASPDRSSSLDIMVAINFTLPENKLYITLSGRNITDAQQTDIFETVASFIYQAAKVDLPERLTNNIDDTTNNIDNSHYQKSRFPKAIKTVFKAIGIIGTIAAAVVAVYEAFCIFF